MHLLLLDLCVFLNLLAIEHILICIWRLAETSISTLTTLLLLNPITSYRQAFVLLVLHRIRLMAYLQSIGRLLAAQQVLVSGLASHSIGAVHLRSIHKSKLT